MNWADRFRAWRGGEFAIPLWWDAASYAIITSNLAYL